MIQTGVGGPTTKFYNILAGKHHSRRIRQNLESVSFVCLKMLMNDFFNQMVDTVRKNKAPVEHTSLWGGQTFLGQFIHLFLYSQTSTPARWGCARASREPWDKPFPGTCMWLTTAVVRWQKRNLWFFSINTLSSLCELWAWDLFILEGLLNNTEWRENVCLKERKGK